MVLPRQPVGESSFCKEEFSKLHGGEPATGAQACLPLVEKGWRHIIKDVAQGHTAEIQAARPRLLKALYSDVCRPPCSGSGVEGDLGGVGRSSTARSRPAGRGVALAPGASEGPSQ